MKSIVFCEEKEENEADDRTATQRWLSAANSLRSECTRLQFANYPPILISDLCEIELVDMVLREEHVSGVLIDAAETESGLQLAADQLDQSRLAGSVHTQNSDARLHVHVQIHWNREREEGGEGGSRKGCRGQQKQTNKQI